MRSRASIAFLVFALATLAHALLTFRSSAEYGSRCRAVKPNCRIDQEAVCICPSRTCADRECGWVCGSRG